MFSVNVYVPSCLTDNCYLLTDEVSFHISTWRFATAIIR